MAQLASAGFPASSGPTRVAQVGAYVSTDSYANVQSTAASGNVSLGSAEFSYDQPKPHDNFSFENRGSRDRPAQHRWSLLQTSSETFAKILESFITGLDGSSAGNGSGQSFQGNLARAISTYETNAKVIHGDLALVGSTLSIRL